MPEAYKPTPEELLASVKSIGPDDATARFRVLAQERRLNWNGQDVRLRVGSEIRCADYGWRLLDLWVREFGLMLYRLPDPPPDAISPSSDVQAVTTEERGSRKPTCPHCGREFEHEMARKSHVWRCKLRGL